ncbi:MAG: UDP-N-acetylmuramate--L-alanine ligase [Flavobacteriales bacterium]|nr:UDP-N-acetylmuramate--L-alanine ligase [Bacteroidota bacterium]MCB9240993.1 UDP-N-acetylmuramate--L-alanine ligase [Flavobacteriales bacterium]
MIEQFQHIYFIGIGGIGMSSLARYFNQSGRSVSGYDKTPSALTDQLQQEGIDITFLDDEDVFIRQLDGTTSTDVLVVLTPAIPKDSRLLNYVQQNGYTLKKRAEVLGLITRETVNLSVAGTHGKTTTSTLLAHLLTQADKPTASFLGGLSANFNSNYHNTIPSGKTGFSVAEADEFDRSFLHLKPMYAAITSVDADHLDIYGTAEELKKAFTAFGRCVQPEGTLYVQVDQQSIFHEAGINITTYGIEKGTISGRHVHIHDNRYVFDLYVRDTVYRNLILGIPGLHNVENAVVASAMALDCGISEQQLRDGLSSFRGVKRRFEYILREPVVYIDDYAHHPTELTAFIQSVRAMYPNQRILGIFQPHLYSRTRDFADGFSASLSLLDHLIMMDIYPARELPIDGVDSQMILRKVTCEHELVTKEALVGVVQQAKADVILTMGAGDIDRFVEPLKAALS